VNRILIDVKNIVKLYKYVGSDRIRLSVINSPVGCCIKSVADLTKCLEQTKQKPNNYGLIPVTFVIDSEAQLRLMNRHCEHVACAGGLPVFSAAVCDTPLPTDWNCESTIHPSS